MTDTRSSAGWLTLVRGTTWLAPGAAFDASSYSNDRAWGGILASTM